MEGGTLGEIRWFSGNFAPRMWAYCQGQLLSISTYPALFAILGTTYGGDGRTTFGLPDMRGRVAVGAGGGKGLSYYKLGQKGGSNTASLSTPELPAHTHSVAPHIHTGIFALKCNADEATTDDPSGAYLALSDIGNIYSTDNRYINMSTKDINVDNITGTITCESTGSAVPHNNLQPICGLPFIICIQGTFPERN